MDTQAVAACEAVDECLGHLVQTVKELEGNIVRTSQKFEHNGCACDFHIVFLVADRDSGSRQL